MLGTAPALLQANAGHLLLEKLLLKWTTTVRRILSTTSWTLFEVLLSMIVLSVANRSVLICSDYTRNTRSPAPTVPLSHTVLI